MYLVKFGNALMCLHDIGLNHIHKGQQYNGAESYTQELQQNIVHHIGQKRQMFDKERCRYDIRRKNNKDSRSNYIP